MSDASEEVERDLRVVELATRLRDGRVVSDAAFDEVYPLCVRQVSMRFWTPVAVALRAAQLLVPTPHTRVLDIGSGVGKLCIVGAAATGATFVGVEHREHFVHTAMIAAARIGATTARFLHGDFDIVDVQTFDAIYLYNPFEENCWPADERLDVSVKHSFKKYLDDVNRAQTLLAAARKGTRVVTYHGFGGKMPDGYRLIRRERHDNGHLALSLKMT